MHEARPRWLRHVKCKGGSVEMSRKLVLAGASAVALALLGPSFATEKPDGAAERAASPMTRQTTQVDAQKMIGRELLNASDDKIGSIDSVMLGREGKVQAVIVNVGGFLGLGERNVAINWADIRVSQDGKKVTTALTRDQLKALPEYHYADDTRRGTAFDATDARGRRNAGDTAAARPADKNAPVVDASPMLAYKSQSIVGAKVVNVHGDTVGEVKELLILANGMVRGALMSVGGFLGIGERDVAVEWSDLTIARDGKDIRVMVKLNNDQLKALPEYAENR
jgi:sporulation protein YlmC with PRC-barrel domain